MKTRLKIKSAVLIFLAIIRYTEGLTWNTHMRSAVCCQYEKQLLIWNFTKEENERVTGLHWFFNKTTLVCFASNVTGFMVANLYAGRVERNGTAGIQLKNVSLNDTGEYTLYVKLEEETKRNVQGINLTVVEPPPSQCKPIIKQVHPKGIISCSTACERSPLSVEWIINGIKKPVGIGPYFVVNSSETSEQPICCLRDFKCLDYQTKFCTQNNISFTEDEHIVIKSLADTTIWIIIIITSIVCITVIIVCLILIRRFRLHHTHDYARTHTLCDVPLSENNYDIMLKRLQELEAKVYHFREQDAVEPKHANTVAQCNEDLQQDSTVAGTTDRPLQDSNQHIQIVNNISMDTDFLKNMLHSNTAVMAELQASRKETRKLKRQLCRETKLRRKENRHKYSFEMTQMKCSDFKNNDTDTSETSESEDYFTDTNVSRNCP